MIKLKTLLENQILVPRRSKEERQKNHIIVIQKQLQQYIKNGGQGKLNLSGTPIQSLPDGLEVGGNFYLIGASIQSLPNGLKVGGDFWLNNTHIQSLPNGLEVVKNLDLSGTPIQSLPNGLKVGGDLSLRNTPLSKKYTEEEIRKIIEDKGGFIEGDIYM